MMALDPGYSSRLFNRTSLIRSAKLTIAAIRRVERELGREVSVAVTGKSGIAMAFAMSVMADINIVTIRKENETSHGSKIEGNHYLKDYIVVDDFVDSGDTVRRVVSDLGSYQASHDVDEPVKCLGFIEYCRVDSIEHFTRKVPFENGRWVYNCANNFDKWVQNVNSV